MSAEDQIRRAIAAYIKAHDSYESQTLAELFTEDGVLLFSSGEHRGHAAIRQFQDARRDRDASAGQVRLLGSDPMITVTDNVAEAWTPVVGLGRPQSEAWSVVFFAAWADKFVERQGRWLFSERRVLMF